MKKIQMAEDLALPENAAVQVYAFMGRRGSGKTFAAGRLVEQVIGAGAQVVILDPVGTWWGLRLAADGKSPGIAIPVFGGLHGDIPLAATAGKVVAELAAERATSLVLDVSDFTGADQRRFVADFATEFFHAKKRHRGAVLVVMEEAQEFAPQRVSGETAKMVGAVERMIKLGRNFGIGTALVSQRPQAINKDVLNQAEVLFCFQMTGPQERKTIEGWVQEKGAGGRDVGDQLPSLPVGTALMWSPQWLGLFGKYKILRKATYDASATPDSVKEKTRPLAPIDLDQVKASMAATIEEAKAKDPTELRREVARLRAELAKKPAAQAAPKAEAKIVPAISEPDFKRVERLQERLSDAHVAFAKAVDSICDRLRKDQLALLTEVRDLVAAVRRSGVISQRTALPNRPTNQPQRRAEVASGPSALGSKLGERAILIAVAQHQGGVTREQLTVLTGYKRSTRDAYLQRLRGAGFIDQRGDQILATDAALAELGSDFEPLPTGAALREHWLAKLPEGEKKVLEVVVFNHPNETNREEITEVTGYKRSTRDAYLQRLAARRLVVPNGSGTVAASPELF